METIEAKEIKKKQGKGDVREGGEGREGEGEGNQEIKKIIQTIKFFLLQKGNTQNNNSGQLTAAQQRALSEVERVLSFKAKQGQNEEIDMNSLIQKVLNCSLDHKF